jgi:hypothetical protein
MEVLMGMHALLLNETQLAVFADLRELTEIRASNGKLLGFYMPTAFHRQVSLTNGVEVLGGNAPGALEALALATQLTAVADSGGRVLGYFAPTRDQPDEAKLYAQAAARIDPEELERRRRNTRGRCKTTQEILAHLETLPRS